MTFELTPSPHRHGLPSNYSIISSAVKGGVSVLAHSQHPRAMVKHGDGSSASLTKVGGRLFDLHYVKKLPVGSGS